MLSLGEFSERMDTAFAAKTRGELNVVLADLPGMRLVGSDDPRATVTHPQAATDPDYTGDTIRGVMSSVARRGRWHVPPTLRITSRLASVTLDFTEAVMQTQVVELVLDDYCSSLNLIVPDQATVDLNSVMLVGASTTNRVHTGPPIGRLHIVVRGRVRFGSVNVKQPFASKLRGLLGR